MALSGRGPWPGTGRDGQGNRNTGDRADRTVTAAVSVEAASVGESQSLGRPGKAGCGRRSRRSLHASQKTYKNDPPRGGTGLWCCGKTAAASICLPRHFIFWAGSAQTKRRERDEKQDEKGFGSAGGAGADPESAARRRLCGGGRDGHTGGQYPRRCRAGNAGGVGRAVAVARAGDSDGAGRVHRKGCADPGPEGPGTGYRRAGQGLCDGHRLGIGRQRHQRDAGDRGAGGELSVPRLVLCHQWRL
ncbi:Uncharacterised protein [Flavonifractor plautii]|nr:Uncharacterised protein [Flavonifractor plautii]